jgi:hypothetical protein
MRESWHDEHPIVNSDLNLPFGEVQKMSRVQFHDWIEQVLVSLGESWVRDGIPPCNGVSREEIEHKFQLLSIYPIDNFLICDDCTANWDVISPVGCPVSLRCFLSNMDLCGDGNHDGLSIIDYLVRDELRGKWHHELERNIKRDSLYEYSDVLMGGSLDALGAHSGVEWIKLYYGSEDDHNSFWLEAISREPQGDDFTLTGAELTRVRRRFAIPSRRIVNRVGPDAKVYRVRVYKKSRRIFPIFFRVIRRSLVVQGTNFPAPVAKCLYHQFTKHLLRADREIIIFDPCAGYGARECGALAAACDRPIRYIGSDPNSTNWLPDGQSRYDILADEYRSTVGQRYHAAVEVYKIGAEEIHKLASFQRYREKIDLILTSPPFFCAEIYVNEPTQSAIKFPTYPEWRDGFLRPTLKTCAEYLRLGGYLLWNIADVGYKGKFLPLERDSINAMEEFGLEFVGKYKLLLAVGPNGTRLTRGHPRMKNYVVINGTQRRYEPIFVFRRPTKS